MAALEPADDERPRDKIILAKMHAFASALNTMQVSQSDEIPTSVEHEAASERAGHGKAEAGGGASSAVLETPEAVKAGAEKDRVGPPPSEKSQQVRLEGEGGLVRHKPAVVSERQKRLNEALKAKVYDSMDKDGSYFSYVFLEKLYDDVRECRFCGVTGSCRLPAGDDALELYVGEAGVVGRQTVECIKCGQQDVVTSSKYAEEVPKDPRLKVEGVELRYFCKKVTHFEVLHDLMELLHVAAMDDEAMRIEKHAEVAEFMLRNVRKVCEEWCRPEYAELRLKKYLRLREETLLTTFDPKFTPDCSQEYREMYGMIADSFRENRDNILLLLNLLKDTLIESPSRPTFMMWVSIGMMHSENYHRFKGMYDSRSFMRVDETEYTALKDRYLALDVPLGIKKIPVVFVLFEIPRFYHYVDFLTRRLGKSRSRCFLTRAERDLVGELSDEGQRLGIKKEPKSGQMISPEAHLDFLTKKEEMERAMIYRSCRDRDLLRLNTEYALGLRDLMPQPESRQTGKPVVMSTDEFRSVLYDHLKKNAASPANQAAPISPGGPPGPNLHSRQARREAKRGRRKPPASGEKEDQKTVLVAQVDTDLLRRQGFRVSANSKTTTVVYSKDGKLEHILEGVDTPEQVKAFLSQKYKAQARGGGSYVPVLGQGGAGSTPPFLTTGGAGAAGAAATSATAKKKSCEGGADPEAWARGGASSTSLQQPHETPSQGGEPPAEPEGAAGKRRKKKRKPRKTSEAIQDSVEELVEHTMCNEPLPIPDTPTFSSPSVPVEVQRPPDSPGDHGNHGRSFPVLAIGGASGMDELDEDLGHAPDPDPGARGRPADAGPRRTARDRFRCCASCGLEIHERIQLCSACKRAAYCNASCQRAHWKAHKTSCAYSRTKRDAV